MNSKYRETEGWLRSTLFLHVQLLDSAFIANEHGVNIARRHLDEHGVYLT